MGKVMDYRPVATRTRAKRDEAFLRVYMEEMRNRGREPAMSQKRRSGSQNAYSFHVGESSISRKRSFECVDDVVSRSFDSGESVVEKKKKTGEKRKAKEAFVSVKKSEDGKKAKSDGCGWRVVNKKGVEFVDLIDSDDGDDDGVIDNDDDMVVAIEEGPDSDEESEFLTDEDSMNEDHKEDRPSSSSDEASEEEEETEKESAVLEKNEKEREGESVKETSNANVNVNDLHSSSCGDQDIGGTTETLIKEEVVELAVPEGNISNDDVQVQTEESVRVFPPQGNAKADVDDVHSCSAYNVDVRSEQVHKKKSPAVNADGDDRLYSSRHDGRLGKEDSAGFGDVRNNQSVWKKVEGVKFNDYKKYKRGVGVGLKEKGKIRVDVQNQFENSEGKKPLTNKYKTSTRAPRQKWQPTIEFKPPNIEFLPQRFSFDEKKPTVPEKSEHERETENLFAEWENAKACSETYENATADPKAKGSFSTKSLDARKNKNGEAPGGSHSEQYMKSNCVKKLSGELSTPRTPKDCNDFTIPLDSKADDSSRTRALDKRKNENDETYGGSHPEPYMKENCEKKLSSKLRSRPPKDCNAFTLLLDAIYDVEEASADNLPPVKDIHPEDEVPKDKSPEVKPLPLFFTFGPPSSPPPEKPAFQIEIDNLFAELDFAKLCNEIGSAKSNVVESNTLPPGKELTQLDLCGLGRHDLELDEEVGLLCRYCPYVHREIRNMVPDFAPNPYGIYGKRFEEEDGDQSILDGLEFNDNNSAGSSSNAPTEGTVWDLIPDVKSTMYPHQCEGFEFIWRHLAGGTELGKLPKPSAFDGDGCIISHAPGTGKTRLTIIFIQSYMNFNPQSRPLIVAPRTMLLTWEEEFKKWGFDIPFHNVNNLEFTGKEDKGALNLVRNSKRSDMTNLNRMVKLKSWAKKKSILGISYSLFEQICGAPKKKIGNEEMSKVLLDLPGLVVFDEGHNPRNDQSHQWNSLLRLKTQRRIILSGTPFQNNFDELYNTVRLVRPQWTTSQWPSYQVKSAKVSNDHFADDINRKRAREVRDMISPFVHVYKGSILQDKLPGLRNSVIVLQPTDLQHRYSARVRQITNPFKYERIEAKMTIHPSLLLTEEKFTFFEEDEYAADWDALAEIKSNPEAGVKARFTVDLIRLCEAMQERVLVFSQWVDPLLLIRDLLKSQFHWSEGTEIIYMDGKCDAKQRQSSMSYFNDTSTKAKVLLATTKSCNEGISLVGASRVVLLDVTWNPSVERQAISRAYRLGQKKIVSVYHLLMAGTREENKYTRQVEKHRLSELVFSCSDTAAAKKIPAAVAEDKILQEMVQHERLEHIFHSITLLDEASYLDDIV